MKNFEIKDVDLQKGIVRITYGGERWYFDRDKKDNGLPVYIGRPAITWVGGYWYKGPQYWKWIAEKNSWAEVENILAELGEKGTRVHKAIELMFTGTPAIDHSLQLPNSQTDREEELTGDEFEAVILFRDYWNDDVLANYTDICIHAIEESLTVKGGQGYERGYGCTVDLVFSGVKDGQRIIKIIDFKTSANIHDSHTIQMTGIKKALME